MPSVWIRRRPTKAGEPRYHVLYHLGRPERAAACRMFRLGARPISARRGPPARSPRCAYPTFRSSPAAPAAPTFAAAAEHWRASRIDATDGTRVVHRVALQRAMPLLGDLPLGEITTEHGIRLVTSLSDAGARRGTIRKTLTYARAVLDEADIEPNPLRDKRVRLPHEEDDEIVPPEAEHVKPSTARSRRGIARRSSGSTGSGARVSSVDLLLVGDYDEPRSRIRLRKEISKTRRGLWVDLPAELAAALSASLAPREDRDPAARLSLRAEPTRSVPRSARPERRSASRRSRRTTSGTGASASCIGKAGRSPRSSRSSDTASSRSPPTSTRTSSSTDARSTCPRSSPHEGPADRTRPPDRAYPRGGSGQPRDEPARVRAARPARPTADPPRPLEARTAARARTLAHDAAERSSPN